MKLQLSITGILAVWYFLRRWYNGISSIIEPLIIEVENRALDGVIDKADRKGLVMKAIALLEEQKKIKLNLLSRLIISKVVDKIAEKLPDFKVSQDAAKIIDQTKVG